MKRMVRLYGIGLLLLFCMVIENSYGISAPFHKGINLTGWFQVDNPQQIQFTKYTRTDFAQIKSLGCDVVRLPVNLHYMTNGDPDYSIDPLFYSFLDQMVGRCEELEINLIIDNHTSKNCDNIAGTIIT